MSKTILIDDFPKGFGGSELVNKTVFNKLLVDEFIASVDFEDVDAEAFYIISNISTMQDDKVDMITNHANYIILEHDYKFVRSRHPWRYENSIVPPLEIINKNLYKNAKAVFVQTTDHLSVFRDNKIEGNFIDLKCSIWSDEELDYLESINLKGDHKSYKFCVVQSSNWIKNQQGAEEFLKFSKIDYELIKATSNTKEFLLSLGNYSALVFFPIARESCCRLIVEARCLGMNVITSPNSGAWKSEWYSLSGNKLISYLREQSKTNLKLMESFL